MPTLRYRTSHIAFYLFLLVLTVASGCGRGETARPPMTEPGEILAKVGEDIITVDDYKKEFALLPESYRDFTDLHKRRFLESIINKHLLLQEAKRRDLQKSENVTRLLEKVKEEIMIQELIDGAISDKAEITDGEIDEYYRENRDNYISPAKIRASHILVGSELLAENILADLGEGADFAELAGEHSLDIPTKDKGGDLGYFAKGTFLSDFEEACDKLNVDEISGVVGTDLGYHIIKVSDKKEREVKTLREVKDAIARELLLAKEISLYEKLLQGLKDNQKISINEELIEKLDPAQLN